MEEAAAGCAPEIPAGTPSSSVGAPSRRVFVLRSVRQGGSLVLFYLMLALFGLTSLLWSLPALVLVRILPRRISRPLGQWMIMAGFRYYLAALRLVGIARFDLSALDALRHERRLVIAANHPSLMDAVLVISRLPRVTCAMKAGIIDNLCLGGGARMAGYLRNDNSFAFTRQAVARLRAGDQLLIFPEGTRTTDLPLGAFKGGFALLAKHAGAPVQTVFLESNSPFLSKGWPLFRKPQFPLLYSARLGQRFEATGSAQALTAQIEAYFREELSHDRDLPDRVCLHP